MTSRVDEAGDPVELEALDLPEGDDLEADLSALARRQLRAVMPPQLMQLRRLVIGEATRFPELGRAFYERGQGRTVAALASAFERLAARGALELDDPERAASHFNWLVMSAPVNRAMLLGDGEIPSAGRARPLRRRGRARVSGRLRRGRLSIACPRWRPNGFPWPPRTVAGWR